jgi:hypothetical protein
MLAVLIVVDAPTLPCGSMAKTPTTGMLQSPHARH